MRSKPQSETRYLLGYASPVEFKCAMDIARERDVASGGYLDAGSACINFWCGPDNKPDGWPPDVEMTRGAFSEPREYVAFVDLADEQAAEEGIEFSWHDNTHKYRVLANITIYELANPRQLGKYGRCDGDETWVRKQWRELIAEARKRVPPPLRLELGEVAGLCMKCGGPLRLITRVISSPWRNGVGDWKHWCEQCQAVTLPASFIRAQMEVDRLRDALSTS